MKILKWVIGLFVLILLAGVWYAYPQLKIGAGYAAKMACSCHYIQGRTLADIKATDLNFSILPQVSFSEQDAQQSITTSFWGLVSQTAYWRGDGCTLQADPGQDLPPMVDLDIKAALPWPRYDTLPEGVDTSLLAQAGDLAFKPIAGGGSRAVVVIHDGRLVYQRYAPGFTAKTPLLGWSMTKSVTNALVGLAVKSEHLGIRDTALFTEWDQDRRAAISVDDLLQMNSGLDWNELYGSVSDATLMLYRQPDMGQYAVDKPADLAPADHWAYSSGTTNILSHLLRERLASNEAYEALLYDSLFAAIDMRSARIERDQSGHFVGSSYGWATAQDWARFGQLYLQDGRWNDLQVLPEGWVAYSREEAEGSEGIYGAQVWLRTADAASAPEDIFMFRGFQDQRIIMVPSHDAVIVRLGMNADQTFPLDAFLTKVLAGLPASR